jgi:hypothetical protein
MERPSWMQTFLSHSYQKRYPITSICRILTLFFVKQYTILDDTEDSIFMNVRHTSGSWGHTYASDGSGTNFELSLEYTRRERY